jgi:hypothetical protein
LAQGLQSHQEHHIQSQSVLVGLLWGNKLEETAEAILFSIILLQLVVEGEHLQ